MKKHSGLYSAVSILLVIVLVAGISLCGIKEQINGANRLEYERMVRQTAAKISEQLGYMKR